jgi:nucleotide-binding universal stress UspA family protein
MINKILVAVDRSKNGKSIFNSALSLAQTTGAELMLLQVVSIGESGYPILPTYTYYPVVDDREYDTYQKQLAEYKQWGLDFLQNLTQEATAKGVTTEYTQLTGNPGRMICELAGNWSADLIVVGSRGLKGLKEMFLGSVSNYVTHHAPCSVLIVRQPIDTNSHQETSEKAAIDREQLITNPND